MAQAMIPFTVTYYKWMNIECSELSIHIGRWTIFYINKGYVIDWIWYSILFKVYSWLSGGNTVTNTPAMVAEHIIQAANAKLSEAVRRNFDEPKSHLQSFGELLQTCWFSKYDVSINCDVVQEDRT